MRYVSVRPIAALRSCLWMIAPCISPQAVGPGIGVAVGAGVIVGVAVGTGVDVGIDVAVGSAVAVSIAVGATVGVSTAEGARDICVAWSALGRLLPATQPAQIIDPTISIAVSVFRCLTGILVLCLNIKLKCSVAT